MRFVISRLRSEVDEEICEKKKCGKMWGEEPESLRMWLAARNIPCERVERGKNDILGMRNLPNITLDLILSALFY